MAADFGGELQALQNEILRLELINRRAQVEALNSAYIRILVRMRKWPTVVTVPFVSDS